MQPQSLDELWATLTADLGDIEKKLARRILRAQLMFTVELIRSAEKELELA